VELYATAISLNPPSAPLNLERSSFADGSSEMIPTLIAIGALILFTVGWIKRSRDQREFEQHSITPQALHDLLTSDREVLVFDVRLPLDLLADSEIIPGAKRIAPREVLENPSLIPREKETVVYCTCPSDKTSRAILRKALAMDFTRIKFLKGGLDGWKAKGYPVEPYTQSFHLDSSS
jgi:rhodanese-related sulfurtransferase